jgi:AAA ATPase domain
LFLRVTPLTIKNLAVQLENWLQQDWEKGLHNVNQLITYTLQFYTVVKAVNQVLASTLPQQIIWRVSRLAEVTNDWEIIYFASTNLTKQINNLQIVQCILLFRVLRERIFPPIKAETILDTPARATAAGFWYLHSQEPHKALTAFTVVRSLVYGEEMFTLAQTLTAFHSVKEPTAIASLQLPAFPSEPLLRPTTWQVLTSLCLVVEDTKVIQYSISRAARAFALNRALGELKSILNNPQSLPNTERDLIICISENWQAALLHITSEVGEIAITKPIINPYVIGDPVFGSRFVGREDVIRQLEELWVTSHQLQSVVLYGHRRMGKTSILRNVTNSLGTGIKVAYVNLLEVGDATQGVVEVVMAICDAISEAVLIPPPSDNDLFNFPLPTFRRYLQQIIEFLNRTSGQGLIIALDEFEKIEELIDKGKIPTDFMGFLRGLIQKSSQIAFAFAGLHTLEEMTADYFQPFFASVIPIHVDFIEAAVSHQILANPNADFSLDYTDKALDYIYHLTSGQPYLIQLIGFQLVRYYNNQVFEIGRSRDPFFTIEDVKAIINNPEFFQRGRYYFDGVWGQAARGTPGQHLILKILAPLPSMEERL